MATKRKSGLSPEQQAIVSALEKLGGKVFSDERILHEGDKLVIPANMSHDDAIKYITFDKDELERTVQISQTFDYRPWDGAVCMFSALHRVFGAVAHKGTQGFFGPNPPELISIKTGVNEEVQVPWGTFELPLLPKAKFYSGTTRHPVKGILFQLAYEGPKRHSAAVQGIFKLVEDELQRNSIYRGKAFDGQQMPEFIDLTGVDPSKVVYAQETYVDLETNIWAQLELTESFVEHNIPLKRAVLLYGPFGTGKTLGITLTGQKAVANGWTFIVARPGRDNLLEVMSTAQLYEPAVVVYEDVDRLANPDTSDDISMSQVLDAFDGIVAKSTRILVVMTTNHVEDIHAGMLRPGRLDACIEINKLDPKAVETLIRLTVDERMLDPEVDWDKVAEATDGYLPAFLTETATRAKRYGLVKCKGDTPVIGTEDLVQAAGTLRLQYTLHNDARTEPENGKLHAALSEVVVEGVKKTMEERGF